MAFWVTRIVRLMLISSLLCFMPYAVAEPELTSVRLQLKWLHQFQFAGFYAARHQGYYREAGLDVVILENEPERDPTQVVLSGDAEFGVATSGLAIHRAEGKPVVVLGVIFQHSPYVVLARTGQDLRSVHDLAGKRLLLEGGAEELISYLRMEQVPLESIEIVPHEGNVTALLEGRVDAMTAYTTTEPFHLQRAGFPYQLLNPRSSGIDYYGDTLFTTESLLKQNEQLVRAFRDATFKGWRYALDNTEEIIDLIIKEYDPQASRDALRYEAREIHRLMVGSLVPPGHMYEGRWRHIVSSFAEAGLMSPEFSLDGFLYLPEADVQTPANLTTIYTILSASIIVSVLASIIMLYFHRLNYRMRLEIKERTLLEQRLRELARTDWLTGVMNRRHFMEVADQEVSRSRRYAKPLSVLMMDLDHFKNINDRYGHAAGDEVLVAFVRECQRLLREEDSLARMGGEEFAILLPETGLERALIVAEKLRKAIEFNPVERTGEPSISLTISIGCCELSEENHDIEMMLSKADQALYRAKKMGRNQVAS
ncbi:GGDEF domain-containing protein [Nitrincola alkalilacustris]|uniref:GGDEF domain-containing protein n=1 Tax=Nitrincola alkalilacustris TaxID=1571224 RepID=UPI00124CC990|nr:GGDEF domain-containing protein [Nitrincola alkalilacustris]